jgi:hypothetical protein
MATEKVIDRCCWLRRHPRRCLASICAMSLVFFFFAIDCVIKRKMLVTGALPYLFAIIAIINSEVQLTLANG